LTTVRAEPVQQHSAVTAFVIMAAALFSLFALQNSATAHVQQAKLRQRFVNGEKKLHTILHPRRS